jgi:argininosuccinate lyase
MAKKLWGGRFTKKTDKDFEVFSKSIQYDYKLARYDILYSLIHVTALEKVGILKAAESLKLVKALGGILKDVKTGKFKPDLSTEDIHTEIQNRVEKKVGKLALKLHSLRSRNEQVVFDEKWYCLESSLEIGELLITLIANMFFLGKKNESQPIVGYTHTQRAQVVPFMDYIMAFNRMFERDDLRLERFCSNLFAYIGAGALAGSSISRKSYREAIRQYVGQDSKTARIRPLENSLDNVAQRDFVVEFLSILSILQMHLSRLCEDFILYSTKEFQFFDLPEEFCTGSSLMPHKKNPDFLESTEVIKDELKIMAKFVKKIKLNKDRINGALSDEGLYATELAEFLVYEGVPFLQAHEIIGRLVLYSETKKTKIKDMSDKTLARFHKKLKSKVIKKIMNPKYAVLSKKSLPTGKEALPKKLSKVKS